MTNQSSPKIVSRDDLIAITHQAGQKASQALMEILNCECSVELSLPVVLHARSLREFIAEEIGTGGAMASMRFHGQASGFSIFLMSRNHLERLIEPILQQNNELGSLQDHEAAILEEVGNVLLNISVGTILNRLELRTEFQAPQTVLAIPEAGFDIDSMYQPGYEQTEWIAVSSELTVGFLQFRGIILVAFFSPLVSIETPA